MATVRFSMAIIIPFAFSLSRTDLKEEVRLSPSCLSPDSEVCREHSLRASRMLSVDFMG